MEKVYKLIGVWGLMLIKIGLHLSVVFNDGVMGFIKGIQVYGEAWKILFSRQFRYFLWFPVLILAGLFFGGNWLINELGNGLYGLAEPVLQEWINGISWLQWMGRATEIVIKVILRLLYFFLFISFGGYLLLVVMSPVYSWLSERAEVYLTGRDYPFSWRRLFWEIFRGILITLRNMFWQLLIYFFFLFFSFIPLIGWISPLALFVVSAYFYGFSFVDYAVERKRYNVRQSVRYVNHHIGMVTGIGAVFALALMIPWVSIVVCSFVSLLSVIAGTIAVNKLQSPLPEKQGD